MAPKGLSFDEKRKRMIEIFYETRDFFTLKELEKMAPKQKGIVVQSVKEVLDSLIADGLVLMEKIGSSNYYWSFPSQGLQVRKNRLADLDAEIARLDERRSTLENEIARETIGREPTDERTNTLRQLADLQAKKAANDAERQTFRDCDPALLKTREDATRTAVQAANRWTDNVFALKGYVGEKFNMDAPTFYQAFEIPADFDYLE